MSNIILGVASSLSLWVMTLFAVLFITAAIVNHRGRLTPIAPATAVRRFVIGIVLAAALIGTTNYLINPLGIYPVHFLEPVGDHTRADKIQLIQQLSSPADILIMGSSRSMNIQLGDIQRETGLSAFNAGVDAAVPRDYLGMFLYLEAHNRLPKVFLVGLGLEQMSKNDQDARYESFDPLDNYVPSQSQLSSVLSITQTEATFWEIGVIVAGQYLFNPMSRLKKLYLDNGSQSYVTTPASTEEAVTRFLSLKPDFSDHMSEEQVNHLRSFIELCKRRHIRLIIYIPPYHPRVLTYYEQKTSFPTMEQKVVTLLNDLQKTYPFDFYNFIDVKTVSGDSSDFIDNYHPNDAGQQKIMAAILRNSILSSESDVF